MSNENHDNRETTMWSGRRTGIRVEMEPEYDEFGIEDPAKVFAAAKLPRRWNLGDTTAAINVPVPLSPPGRVAFLIHKREMELLDIESVKTASPDSRAAASRDPPQQLQDFADNDNEVEKPSTLSETNDFPEQEAEEPEDDLIPPPPLASDDDDDSDDEPIARAAKRQKELAQDNSAEKDTESDTEEDDQPVSTEHRNNFVNDDGDDNGEDDSGAGFAMADSVVTPTSPAGKRKRKPGRKKKEKTVRIRTPEEEDRTSTEEEESVEVPPKKRTTKNRFAVNITPKGRPQPRSYREVSLSALQSNEENDGSVRRSSRVHIAPLEWWKGETYIYGPNNFGRDFDGVTNMSIVKGIKKPNPTPYKKVIAIREAHKKPKPGKQKKKREIEDDTQEYDQYQVEKMYVVNEGDTANLANDYADEISRIKILSRFRTQVHQDLPLLKGQRTKREGNKVGKATQCFNRIAEITGLPSFISGTLILPPRAIKDAESVLSNVQHFTVIACQPKALEVAYADPRDDTNVVTDESAEHFLVERADTFYVPAGNAYRLVNHSTTTEAIISWVIIRNTMEEEDVYDDEE